MTSVQTRAAQAYLIHLHLPGSGARDMADNEPGADTSMVFSTLENGAISDEDPVVETAIPQLRRFKTVWQLS